MKFDKRKHCFHAFKEMATMPYDLQLQKNIQLLVEMTSVKVTTGHLLAGVSPKSTLTHSPHGPTMS